MRHRRSDNRSEEREEVAVYCDDRTIYFFDEVNEYSVCKAIRFIDALEKATIKKEIVIKLDSGGGNCYDGLALYDRIRQSSCQIITKGTGLVASMALILFLSGDEREITENTRLLSHQVSVNDFSGRAEDFKIEQREIDYLNEALVSIISERTGQSESKVRKDQKAGDYWIGAERAIDEGYADKIIKNTRTYRRKKKSNER